jgi:hypothetical protein
MEKRLRDLKTTGIIYLMLRYVYLGWTIRTIKSFTRFYFKGRER